ncbi:MAG: Fe-S cluster domain-containing protein, partial [bacterium]
MNLIVASLITLGVIGCVAAIVLYFVAQKFKVVEDPRIDQVEAVLPGANCGGCGFPGCRGFADACVKAGSLEGKSCPVGGGDTMTQIADILGLTADVSDPKVAVLRCSGSCANRPRTTSFDGAKSCKVAAQLYAGETGCFFGCTGFGDCVSVCSFDAIKINPTTGLPEIDEEKCTSCGACIKECPKNLLELRKKGIKSRRVFVSCANKDKGGVARKACSSACIGCGKCQKACPFDAITIENNLAYIDADKCKLCRKCVVACPTGAIVDVNFPTPPPQPKPAAPKPAPAKADAAPVAKPAPAPKPVVAAPAPVEAITPQPVVAEPAPVPASVETITPQPEVAKPVVAAPVKPVAPVTP